VPLPGRTISHSASPKLPSTAGEDSLNSGAARFVQLSARARFAGLQVEPEAMLVA
jgi:hypothetical protein